MSRAETIRQLRQQGKSIDEICEVTNQTTPSQRHDVIRICRKAGMPLTSEEKKQSREHEKDLKRHDEDWVRDYVLRMSDGRYEYVSEYKSLDIEAKVKCTTCGEVRTINMARFRWAKFKGQTVRCDRCYYGQARAKRKAEAEEKHIAKAKAEDARRIKACSGTQATFKFCKSCGAVMFGKHNLKWCDDCRKKHENKNKEISRRIKIKNALVDSDITLNGLLRRDGYVCHICGGLCDVNDYIKTDKTIIAGNNYPSIDHVIPLAKGGLHSWDNVKVAHRICNSLKGDSYDEIEMEKSNNQSHDESWNISRLLR